jgi:DNA-binding CsgD family transcriptional regulator
MSLPSLRSILLYGALAAAVLVCLRLISLAPLQLDWGRELVGAAIALVALVIGARLRERHSSPSESPTAGAEAPPDTATTNTAAPDLSPREREVLALLAEGMSNKEMARTLSVSENTVKTHLANLYAKLGAGRRTEALKIAQRHRLIG